MSRVKKAAGETGGCAKTVVEDSWGNIKQSVKNHQAKKTTKRAKEALNQDLKESENELRKAYIANELNSTASTRSELSVLKDSHQRLLKQHGISLGVKKAQSIDSTMSKIMKNSRTEIDNLIRVKKATGDVKEILDTPKKTPDYKGPSKLQQKQTDRYFKDKRDAKDKIKQSKAEKQGRKANGVDPEYDVNDSVEKELNKDKKQSKQPEGESKNSRQQRLDRRAKNIKKQLDAKKKSKKVTPKKEPLMAPEPEFKDRKYMDKDAKKGKPSRKKRLARGKTKKA